MITDIDGMPLSLEFTTTKIGEREWLRTKSIKLPQKQKFLQNCRVCL
jgi:hypothetical protein